MVWRLRLGVTVLVQPYEATRDDYGFHSSIQIQAVLNVHSATRMMVSLDSIAAAVRKAEVDVVVRYGDRGVRPLLSARDVAELNVRFGDSLKVEYEYFGDSATSSHVHNQLAEACLSEYLCLIDPTIVMTPHCLGRLHRALKGHSVGIADAKQIPIEDPKDYDPTTGKTSWASDVCTLISSSLFGELGGYDEVTFPAMYADVDLSWRVREGGRDAVHQPAAVVYNDRRFSRDAMLIRDYDLQDRILSLLLLAHKWSRDDVVESLLESGKHDLVGDRLNAIEEYMRRQEAGALPGQLDPEHRVGCFDSSRLGYCRYELNEERGNGEL